MISRRTRLIGDIFKSAGLFATFFSKKKTASIFGYFYDDSQKKESLAAVKFVVDLLDIYEQDLKLYTYDGTHQIDICGIDAKVLEDVLQYVGKDYVLIV